MAKLSLLDIPGRAAWALREQQIDMARLVVSATIHRIPIKPVEVGSADLFGKFATFSNCHRNVCMAIIHVVDK